MSGRMIENISTATLEEINARIAILEPELSIAYAQHPIIWYRVMEGEMSLLRQRKRELELIASAAELTDSMSSDELDDMEREYTSFGPVSKQEREALTDRLMGGSWTDTN
jgi:hypothetical protein